MESFSVWLVGENEGDGGDPVEADTPSEAAEIWAEEVDRQAGLEIAKEQDRPKVNVKDKSGRVTTWEVHGEMLPSYSAFMPE